MKKAKKEFTILDNYTLLCIDPSERCTGIAVLKINNKKPLNFNDKHLDLIYYDIIPTHGMELGESVYNIEKKINQIIDIYHPTYITAESPFVGQNRVTIQRLAGVHSILDLIAFKHNHLRIVRYAVMSAKSATLDKLTLKKLDGTRKTGDELKLEVCNKILDIIKDSNKIKQLDTRNSGMDISDAISIGCCFIKNNGNEIEKKKKTRKKKK